MVATTEAPKPSRRKRRWGEEPDNNDSNINNNVDDNINDATNINTSSNATNREMPSAAKMRLLRLLRAWLLRTLTAPDQNAKSVWNLPPPNPVFPFLPHLKSVQRWSRSNTVMRRPQDPNALRAY